MATPRLFTMEEATALLPRLRSVLPSLQELQRQLDVIAGARQDIGRIAGGNGSPRDDVLGQAGPRGRARELRERLDAGLEEIASLGCAVKDLGRGLVDFPTLRDGVVVYLCWQLGEERIAFWHGLEAGFGGRQPLQ